MDRITKSSVEQFVKDHQLSKLEEDVQFEAFAAYCSVSREHSETFAVEDLLTGSGNDTGIDAVAVIVNSELIEDPEDIQSLVSNSKRLDVVFVFVQAKRGTSFNGAEMSSFFFGVKDFFSDKPKLTRNEEIKKAAELANVIFSNAAHLLKKPACKLYYVTAGKWVGDKDLAGRIETARTDLQDLNLFDKIEIVPVDADQLHLMYRSTTEASSVEIVFQNRCTLPDINGIKESYVGTLPAEEYLKLVTDDVGNVRKSVFYDNVRDFQGSNDVNMEIDKTLRSSDAVRFPVLNNGITVVARELLATGNRFQVRDYQVVNGCQTSHVLFNTSGHFDTSNVHVPIKIIVTTSEDVINSIIKATNRQTAVKAEELAALSEFQKSLETYYATFPVGVRLYYERRSKQYSGNRQIEKTRVVTIPIQIRAFASMFLDLPHRVGGYYGSLTRNIGNRFFLADHSPAPYHAAALALYRLEFMFRNGELDREVRKFRWHMLMMARRRLGDAVPQMSGKKMESYCDGFRNVLDDQVKASALFGELAGAIKKVAGKKGWGEDAPKTEAFRDACLAAVESG